MYNNFTNLYKVPKTLRFALIPQGETLRNIEENGVLEEDFIRDEERIKVQALADAYHRKYIDECLTGFSLEGIDEYARAFTEQGEAKDGQKSREDAAATLIRQISQALTSNPAFKGLFKAEFFKETLPEMFEGDAEALKSLSMFDGFTTYFTGYNKTREFIYNDSGDKGTIGNRLINENLPTFLVNERRLRQIQQREPKIISECSRELNSLLAGDDIKALFEVETYNDVLTQKGIDKYNQIIGGYTLADGRKVRGLNEFINLHNQNVKERSERLPRLTQLRKMILSEKTTLSFIPEQFKTDEEVINALKQFSDVFAPAAEKLAELLADIRDYDLSGVFVRADALSDLSNTIFGSWHFLSERLEEKFDEKSGASEKKKNTKKYKQEKQKAMKQTKSYSLETLDALPGVDGKISGYLAEEASSKAKLADSAGRYLENVLSQRNDDSRSLKRDDKIIALIKDYLDAAKEFRRHMEKLMAEAAVRDETFYSAAETLMGDIRGENKIYNKTRNYLTSKPYKTDKVKLNFGSSVLLDGWSESVEKTKLGTLLFKDGKYYLGIIAKGQGDLFAKVPEAKTDDVYEKMVYNLISGANKSLPHVFFSAKGIRTYKPDAEVLRIYTEGTFKKGKNFSLADCHKLIDFYKRAIAENGNYDCYDFRFSDTKDYEDISGFFREVEAGGYSIDYRPVDKDVVDRLVEEGRLYLFEIWHKDFSEESHGKPDFSTIYWKSIFDPANKGESVYKLNGGAEVFFRKASISEKDIIRHKAGETVNAKNPLSEKQSKVLEHDIIKDKRYTVDKFLLYVPITMNAAAADFFPVNAEARLAIKRAEGVHVIGVSRGEKSLIHITVLDPKGKVVESRSLNVIEARSGSRVWSTDYARLLAEREAERDRQQKSWKSIEGIKQLKDGYLAQVVKVITDLMLKYDAVVVLEDLNVRFKQQRQKIEKAVYQQLEGKIINKLNYLVGKNIDPKAPGGAFRAYQLTAPFESFEKIGKQTGFIFYVSPWNTTAIDSDTGFCNMFDTGYYSVAKACSFWHAFDRIVYDESESAFRFDFDYRYFVNDDKQELIEGTKTKWSAYSHGSRIRTIKTDKGHKREQADLTKAITELLEENGICRTDDDLQQKICDVANKEFHKELLALFSLMVQLRNGTEVISPVLNRKGDFFRCEADENGSLNIARKGLVLVDRIKAAEDASLTAKAGDKKTERVRMTVTGNDYLKYIQR